MSGKKDHKNYLLLIERVDAVIRCIIALQSQIGYSGLFASKSLLLHTHPPCPRGFEGLDVGDRVRVELLGTDVERGFIDFTREG